MAQVAPMTAAEAAAAARAQNMAVRNYITKNCPEDVQQIFSGTVAGGGDARGFVFNVAPKNVGLITSFLVRVEVDIVVPAGMTLTRTPFGAMNLLSKVEFVDLSNLTRISTPGWHIAMLASARHRRPDGAAETSDTPLGFGNIMLQGISAPASIAAGATQSISMVYEVPLAYSKDDLRGAVFASVVNATMSLALTFNSRMTAFGTNTVESVYSQSVAGPVTVNNARVRVYQQYYDQLPISNSGPALPIDDLTTSYQLKSTSLVGLATGQDFPIPFANFSDFLSTCVIFDNGGTLNPGTDINNFQLTTANSSNIWKYEPWVQSYKTRNNIGMDFPLGCYYFDHRRRPINTIQYGNQQLLINPSQVNTGAQLLIGWEQMTKQGVVNASGSLPAG